MLFKNFMSVGFFSLGKKIGRVLFVFYRATDRVGGGGYGEREGERKVVLT